MLIMVSKFHFTVNVTKNIRVKAPYLRYLSIFIFKDDVSFSLDVNSPPSS